MAMAMAVSCAHINVLGPSVIATRAKSSSSSSCCANVAPFRKSYGGRARRSLVCHASSSKKDKGKKRRGESSGKSSKRGDDSKLDEKLLSINDDVEYEYEEIVVGKDDDEDYEEAASSPEATSSSGTASSPETVPSFFNEGELGDRTSQTPGAVVDATGSDDVNEGELGDRTGQTAGAVADAVGSDDVKGAEKSGKKVGDEVDDIREQGAESARVVADEASDAVDASGKRVQKAGERVGENLDEVRKAGQAAVGGSAEVVNQQAGRAAENIQQGVEEAGNTARDIAGIVGENAEEAGERLRQTGDRITEDLQSVGKEGQKAASKVTRDISKQAREASKELGEQAQEVERDAERVIRSSMRKAQQSVERVQEPIEKAVNASIDAAAAIGNEVFRLGDSILEVVEEATGMAGPDRSYGGRNRDTSSETTSRKDEKDNDDEGEDLVGGKYKRDSNVVKRYQGVRDEQDDDEEEGDDEGPFAGLTVLVAGAAGATGRLIVQNLVGKGVTVRALVRNVYRARNLKQLQGAELVEGDLYNYESVKEAIRGTNVVVCAVGARGFNLVQAYRTEYEGVLNLISAAKNSGEIKKFVFMTTIGVNYFQIVPLLYWKRQAELFLQRSGLDYTIVRPAGLTGDRGSERVELRPADSLFMGGVSRKMVADVCIKAIVTPSASQKTVEVVGGSGRVRRSIEDQFESI